MFKSWSFLVIKKKVIICKKKKIKKSMGTHGYLNTHGYLYNGYPRGYGADMNIIFIQRDKDGYHTIRTYVYPLTTLYNFMVMNTICALEWFIRMILFSCFVNEHKLMLLLICVFVQANRKINCIRNYLVMRLGLHNS